MGKATLSENINVKDLTKENLNQKFSEAKFSTSSLYNFTYNPSIQSEKSDIMNAIFEKMGMEKENDAIRLIKFDKFKIDNKFNGDAGYYTVVEINKDGIKEFSINIKGSTDAECIYNLSHLENSYYTYNEDSCTLDGLKIMDMFHLKEY